MKTTGTYEIRVRCTNCRREEYIDIPRGETVESQSCPTCGCKTLGVGLGSRGERL